MKRIVSPKLLNDYAAKYPKAGPSIQAWADRVKASTWANPADLKVSFNDVDPVRVASGRAVYVFNIQRNAHRLVAAIHFNTGMVFVLRLMNHAEYDRKQWKAEL